MGALEILATTRRHKMNAQNKIEYQRLTRESCKKRLERFYSEIEASPSLKSFLLIELEEGMANWAEQTRSKFNHDPIIVDAVEQDLAMFYDVWFEIDDEMSRDDYYASRAS